MFDPELTDAEVKEHEIQAGTENAGLGALTPDEETVTTVDTEVASVPASVQE